jgi:hypothetical protein
MSTLTALKLVRELELTRRAMTERPMLAMQWTIDPQTGRPVAAWQVEAPTVLPTASLVSELA